MENYVVRIYRRDPSDPRKVAGVFESVECQTENSFTHLSALLSLLETRRSGCRQTDGQSGPGRSTADH